jgi:hypothetical protein
VATITEYRTYGDTILERLSGVAIPALLKPSLAQFKSTHGGYEQAAAQADAKRALRDAALAAVGDADDKLDKSIERLAEKATGAQLGKRLAPLAAFTRHTVNELTSLSYKIRARGRRAGPEGEAHEEAARPGGGQRRSLIARRVQYAPERTEAALARKTGR